MRTTTADILAAQASGAVNGNYKVVCNSVTYDESSILHLLHTEDSDTFNATVVLDNSDGTLDSLDIKGREAIISYGVDSDYSGGGCAPLRVIDQQEDVRYGLKTQILYLSGTPDRLKKDEASATFQPEPGDTTTIKTYLQQILSGTSDAYPAWVAGSTYGTADYIAPTTPNGYYYKCTVAATAGSAEPSWPLGIKATIADSGITWQAWGKAATIFSHAAAYTVTFDSTETLLTSVTPADAINIGFRDTRWEAVQQLLSYVASVARPEADGAIHIIEPTVSGTAYQFSYSNASGTTHTFDLKKRDLRLVEPNYISVSSMPDDAVVYTASTANTADNALLDIRTFRQLNLASTAQANSVGSAMLTKLAMQADKGTFHTPMNIVQETYDYITVTDDNGQSVTGNVSNIIRECGHGKFQMAVRLGALSGDRPLPLMPVTLKAGPFGSWFNDVFVDQLNRALEGIRELTVRNQTRLDSHALLTTKAHGGQAALVVMKEADETISANTALHDDERLYLPVAASCTFGFDMKVKCSSGVTPDIKFAFSIPTNASLDWTFVGELADRSDAIIVNLSESSTQSTSGYPSATYLISGVVQTAGTAGNLQFRWAQNTSDAATTKVLKGSYITAYRLNT